jgi:hypothetical protein
LGFDFSRLCLSNCAFDKVVIAQMLNRVKHLVAATATNLAAGSAKLGRRYAKDGITKWALSKQISIRSAN